MISILSVDLFNLLENCFLSAINIQNYDKLKCVDFGLYKDVLNYLSDNELITINGFKTFKRQIEWFGGHLAIKQLVSKIAYIPDLKTISIKKRETGAPYIEFLSDLSISISHSGQYAVGAVDTSPGCSIGIDIEKICDSGIEDLLNVAFTDKEIGELDRCCTDSYTENLYRMWTIKEAFLKYIGIGFQETLKNVEVIEGNVYYFGQRVSDVIIKSFKINDYMTTCISGRQNGDSEFLFFQLEMFYGRSCNDMIRRIDFPC